MTQDIHTCASVNSVNTKSTCRKDELWNVASWVVHSERVDFDPVTILSQSTEQNQATSPLTSVLIMCLYVSLGLSLP